MSNYDSFAAYYDRLTGDGSENVELIRDAIATWRPRARSLLELGCGTGSILAGLSNVASRTGIDSSPAMLNIAARKVPLATLIHGDISQFQMEKKFDVIVCVFDTLNHLTEFSQWLSLINSVAEHLESGGLFIFDVNTFGRFQRVLEEGDRVYDVGSLRVSTTISSDRASTVTWQMSLTDCEVDGDVTHVLEPISELAVELDLIRTAVSADFVVLREDDGTGERPSDDSSRAHFVCQLRS